MGLQHEFDLQVFEEKTGIKPARGERLQILERISAKAFKLTKIIELERSGIRDGYGIWAGSDAVGGMVEDLIDA
jgi:hypothetical protein